MNAAVVEIVKDGGHSLPEAHHDKGLMAKLALDVQETTGFEKLRTPFCMTVEAEVRAARSISAVYPASRR